MIKVIFFDFDGVIVESVDIKTAAFAELFKEESKKHLAGILDYHKKHGGVSRRNKIIYFYKNILRRELSDETLQKIENRFSQYVKDKVIQAAFVKGAQEFIKANFNKYDFYIISGTPQQELEEIIFRKNLSRYFLGVFGSPSAKSETINSLISEKKYLRDDIVFIGDSTDDLEGAEKCGIRFIARVSPTGSNNFPSKKKFPVINDFHDLESILSRPNTA